jgi:predicted RNase H-like HicB family nuclease
VSYPVILTPGEDGQIVARCPVFDGCISQGRTRAEALANVREAIEVCIEADRETHPDGPPYELAQVEL